MYNVCGLALQHMMIMEDMLKDFLLGEHLLLVGNQVNIKMNPHKHFWRLLMFSTVKWVIKEVYDEILPNTTQWNTRSLLAHSREDCDFELCGQIVFFLNGKQRSKHQGTVWTRELELLMPYSGCTLAHSLL